MDFTLRPMSTSEVLDRMFYLYKKNFVLFAGIAILPAVLVLLINLLQVSGGVTPRIGVMPGLEVGTAFGIFLLCLAYLIVYVMASAATVHALSVVHLGKTTSIGGSYKHIQRYFWRLIGIGLLLSLVFLIIFVVIAI